VVFPLAYLGQCQQARGERVLLWPHCGDTAPPLWQDHHGGADDPEAGSQHPHQPVRHDGRAVEGQPLDPSGDPKSRPRGEPLCWLYPLHFNEARGWGRGSVGGMGKSRASAQAWSQEAGRFAELWPWPALVVSSDEKVCAAQATGPLPFVFLPGWGGGCPTSSSSTLILAGSAGQHLLCRSLLPESLHPVPAGQVFSRKSR